MTIKKERTQIKSNDSPIKLNLFGNRLKKKIS